MAHRDLVVIGASAGGVDALRGLVATLPIDLPAAVAVVMHMMPDSPGMLATVLARSGPLPAIRAVDNLPLEPGKIVVAAPDRHLLIDEGRVRVTDGPRDNLHRPSIDRLFQTAAESQGARVIGVVLSGALDDGTLGLATIKRRGGLAIVQDPDEAIFPSMPASALAHVAVDHRARVAEMGPLLVRLTSEPIAPPAPAFSQPLAHPSMLTCPECHGALWEADEDGTLRYRCHVGHTLGLETLISAQHEDRERSLWAAVRALHEQEMLARRIAERARDRGHLGVADRFELQAERHAGHAQVLRGICAATPPPSPHPLP